MSVTSCGKLQANNQASVLNQNFISNQVSPYKLGDTVDDFTLKNVDNNMVSMANYKDAKGFIIVFTCNTCPYAKLYENRIIELDKTFSEQGWQLIAINPNDPSVQEGDSFENMQKKAAQSNYQFPYLYDEGQTVYPKWGAARTPHIFIVQQTSKGSILKYIGAIDDNARDENKVEKEYVKLAIENLEKGKQPNPDFTRAIGCTIKTK